ncbi:MAG: hypothetical protein U0271_21215 [Polyangiaceae bacterium]
MRAKFTPEFVVATLAALALAAVGSSCIGTTGGDLLQFKAFARGPVDAVAGEPYTFVNDRGFTITLDRAKLHVGALYLNRAVPTSVSRDTSCYLTGVYVAELTAGLDIDALSPELQPFPELGAGTTERARTGEIWLSGGDLDNEEDPTVIVDLAGQAAKDGAVYPFDAQLTIGSNRAVPPPDEAQPGAYPICKQRVVSPIRVDFRPEEGGHLVLTVDPAGWFGNVNFAELEQDSTDPPHYRFRDDSTDQPSLNLYNGVRASAGPYTFTWEDD